MIIYFRPKYEESMTYRFHAFRAVVPSGTGTTAVPLPTFYGVGLTK